MENKENAVVVGGVSFSAEQIAALRAQTQLQGESSVGEIFEQNGADTTVKIGHADKVTKPVLKTGAGNTIASQTVTRPSARFAERLGAQQQAAAKQKLEELEAQHAAQLAQSPDAIENRFRYLERSLKKIEKALKEIATDVKGKA